MKIIKSGLRSNLLKLAPLGILSCALFIASVGDADEIKLAYRCQTRKYEFPIGASGIRIVVYADVETFGKTLEDRNNLIKHKLQPTSGWNRSYSTAVASKENNSEMTAIIREAEEIENRVRPECEAAADQLNRSGRGY